MKKLLIIALLFVGCEDAPTEHTQEHDIGHYSCIFFPGDWWLTDYDSLSSFQQLVFDDPGFHIPSADSTIIHAPELEDAILKCMDNREIVPSILDSTWCECEAGILY